MQGWLQTALATGWLYSLASPTHAAVMLYVSNAGDDTVSVIDTSTNTVTATVPVGSNPGALAVLPNGSRVYVANRGDGTTAGTVSVVDTASNSVVATIPVGVNPLALAASPDGSQVYVANFSDGSISVINTGSNAVSASIPVPRPIDLAAHPNGLRLYAVSGVSQPFPPDASVSLIDTVSNTVESTLASGEAASAGAVAVEPDGAHWLVPTWLGYGRNLPTARIDSVSNAVTGVFPLAAGPPYDPYDLYNPCYPDPGMIPNRFNSAHQIIADPRGQAFYVVEDVSCDGPQWAPAYYFDRLLIRQQLTPPGTLVEASPPLDHIAIHPSGRWLYATRPNEVMVLDPLSLSSTGTITVGTSTGELAVGPCTTDADCFLSDSCPIGACDLASGRCVFTPADLADVDLDGISDPCDSDDSPGSLQLMHVHLQIDPPRLGNTGRLIVQGRVRDVSTAGALSTGLLSNTATLQASDGDAFDVTIPLTGCALLRGGPHVGCRWTNGVAQLVRLRDGTYKFIAVQRALPESSTGATTPVAPATAVLRTGPIDQVDSIPASFCRTLGAYTLHCVER